VVVRIVESRNLIERPKNSVGDSAGRSKVEIDDLDDPAIAQTV
jgi:hypothetical protein